MKILITILDCTEETSMPFNEFVIWRANHFKDERQLLIVCNNQKSLPDVVIPDNLTIEYIGNNVLKWRKRIKDILSRYKDKEYAIHLHQSGPSMKVLLVMLGTGFRKKVVFTVHSTFKGYKIHNKIRSYVDGLLSKYVVCCGQTAYASYPKSLKLLKKEKVLAIQNGVDTDRIDRLLEDRVKQRNNDNVVFVYVARMVPVKNHNFLLDVVKQTCPKAKFLLIGKEDKEIVRRINEEGLRDKIEVTGLIPRKEVFERLNNSDAYISTSTLEGLPVSVLEGMYVGIPALLSDIPQHKEIGGNDNFISFLPFNVDQWAKKINAIVSMSAEERKKHGEESKKYIERNFSLHVMHQEYSKIYNVLSSC